MASDGVQKLLEFLQQTRRQAEISIDCLTERVKELERACELNQQEVDKLKEERDFLLQLTEQLKVENSKKWRLQERDDWKALVDSIQKDRDRLQDECLRLETALEQSQAYIEQQESALADVHQQLEESLKSKSENVSDSQNSSLEYLSSRPVEKSHSQSLSPIMEKIPEPKSPLLPALSLRSNENIEMSPTTPRNRRPLPISDELALQVEVKSLRSELIKAHAQRDVERRGAEAIRATQEEEIMRLRERLGLSSRAELSSHSLSDMITPLSGDANTDMATAKHRKSAQGSVDILTREAGSDTSSGGIFGYFFYSSSAVDLVNSKSARVTRV